MDVVISAVASELVCRLISFVSKKYSSQTHLKENLEKLQHLLLRAHSIVEEAEGRHILKPSMLQQLKTLTEAMFRGYDVLDTYMTLEKIGEIEEVSGWPFPITRRPNMAEMTRACSQVESTLENLETTVTNMTEFVVLLSGCKRMFRSPYSGYLYIDNFMFGRQVEKQQVINILLHHSPFRAPTVLPIIGGCRVGKKTLVGNIRAHDRIRSYYSSILHFSGDDIQKINYENFKRVRTLVTIEFISDVSDKEWLKFYRLVALTGKGSKVIIISRLKKLIRFGTVNPIQINSLSQEEYSYLFKVLAFGSANPMEHPRLALVGKELATVFQGSLIMLNVYASVLRNNLNISFWTRMLQLFRVMMHKNLTIFGEHPKTLLEKDGSAVDITGFSLSSLSNTWFRLMLLTAQKDASGGGLPQMSFGDIIAGSKILPAKFQLVWESRLPPHTVICANCTAEMPSKLPPSPMKKRLKLCTSSSL
ncbi:unnamed protein product [Urochloa decumbens]|uniref:Disease resistance N-terminal domain-containing protein n=1 Tax=Urochloa decumbens TaxID=240449 RepID=A0ABC8YFA3_9POAL